MKERKRMYAGLMFEGVVSEVTFIGRHPSAEAAAAAGRKVYRPGEKFMKIKCHDDSNTIYRVFELHEDQYAIPDTRPEAEELVGQVFRCACVISGRGEDGYLNAKARRAVEFTRPGQRPALVAPSSIEDEAGSWEMAAQR
jgi:hypothetical protein